MRSYQPDKYSLPTGLPEEKNNEELSLDSSCNLQLKQLDSISENNFEKDIQELIQALLRGGTKTYAEKIRLASRSSLLALPLLVGNASFIFWDTQHQLENAMWNNVYYKHSFQKLIKTFSYEGSIVSAEAISITTASVILTIFISLGSFIYQGLHYRANRAQRERLIQLLHNNHYPQAAALRFYALSQQQMERIRLLVEADDINELSVIPADSSFLEQAVSDLIWFHGELNKYLWPLLLLSLFPGFILMFQTASELKEEKACSLFSLWFSFLESCPPIQKVERMSLLTYLWGCFSGTYLLSYSAALILRVLPMSFCPSLRQWFQEAINQPYSIWWEKNQHYEKFIKKSLLLTAMPFLAAYSLYSAIQFSNSYLANTGCSNLKKAFHKGLFSGPSYPCSTTQAALGASVFLGEFEFDHLYPTYILIEALSVVGAFILKRLPYFQQEQVLAKIKKNLEQFTALETKLAPALLLGIIMGGIFGLWPAYHMGTTILQKEGFELFFNLNVLLTNLTKADLSNTSLPFDLSELLQSVPQCTINSTLRIPDFHFGNTTLQSFNATLPCMETFFDATANSTILGLQITAPCPQESIYSAFYRNLLHLPLSCDPILVVRTFAGFVVPYWLSVNSGAALSLTLAATTLFSVWALQALRTTACKPKFATVKEVRTASAFSSHRFFSSSLKGGASRRPSLWSESSSDEEVSFLSEDSSSRRRSCSDCWTRLKHKITSFFSSPSPSAEDRRSQQPLLRTHNQAYRY